MIHEFNANLIINECLNKVIACILNYSYFIKIDFVEISNIVFFASFACILHKLASSPDHKKLITEYGLLITATTTATFLVFFSALVALYFLSYFVCSKALLFV
jgi:hypothetical protein